MGKVLYCLEINNLERIRHGERTAILWQYLVGIVEEVVDSIVPRAGGGLETAWM